MKEHDVAFDYRDYKKDLLSEDEIRQVLTKLDVVARDVLRSRDANKLGIGADVSDDDLIKAMAKEPGLLQRPISVSGEHAVVGRPVELLLKLVT